MPTPYSTHVYEEVTSTQDVARSLATKGPVVVVAARQTEGRGRSGAGWETAARALALSMRLEPIRTGWPPDRWTLIPLATGVAVARLLSLNLKWPNDLLGASSGEKVGGILVEATRDTTTIGIGINLWWPDPPPERAGLLTDDPGPDSHRHYGEIVGEAVWTELAGGADRWSYDDYCAACLTLGREITWSDGQRGKAMGIDRVDGSLVVEQSGRRRKLNAGEVSHLR